jgi:hypothetical protein
MSKYPWCDIAYIVQLHPTLLVLLFTRLNSMMSCISQVSLVGDGDMT